MAFFMAVTFFWHAFASALLIIDLTAETPTLTIYPTVEIAANI
jgi:hypothetical protein